MSRYVATKQINILDVGKFERGTKWEGHEHKKGGWELRLCGSKRYYYFPEESMKEAFKEI